MKKLLCLLLIILVVIELSTCFYVVDRAEFAYVTRLGAHVATHDGADSNQAGLHFGWPWPLESVIRLDRRRQRFELPPSELVTKSRRQAQPIGILIGGAAAAVEQQSGQQVRSSDGDVDKTITIDGYVVWRIPNAEAADRFVRTFGSMERAEQYLRDKIRGDLGAEIPKMSLDDLHNARSPERVKQTRDQLSARLMAPHLQSSDPKARTSSSDGIEVVDVRIRRTYHPPQVRQAMIYRIESERRKKAAEYETEGQRIADRIRTDANAKVNRLRARVQAESERVRGEAEAEADRIRNQAQVLDPEYYAELKRRQVALTGFSEDTTVWSTRLWDMLFPDPKKSLDAMPGRAPNVAEKPNGKADTKGP